MKDDDPGIAGRGKDGFDIRFEAGNVRMRGFGIGLVGGGVLGVQYRKFIGDGSKPGLCVVRVQPCVRIGVAVVMIVIVTMVMSVIIMVVAVIIIMFVPVMLVMIIVIVIVMLVMIIVSVVVMSMIVIVMVRIIMPVIISPVPSIAWLGHQSGLGEGLQMGAFNGQQLKYLRAGQRFGRARHPGGQIRPHPDHQIGLRKGAGLRGAQLEMVRVGATVQQQPWRAQIAHYLRDKRVGYGNFCHHGGGLGLGGCRGKKGGEEPDAGGMEPQPQG